MTPTPTKRAKVRIATRCGRPAWIDAPPRKTQSDYDAERKAKEPKP